MMRKMSRTLLEHITQNCVSIKMYLQFYVHLTVISTYVQHFVTDDTEYKNHFLHL